MKYTIIACQGRVADRTDGALIGARRTAEALSAHLGLKPQIVGRPSETQMDDWAAALPAAADTLHALRHALVEALDAERTPVLATNTCAASLATLPEVAERFPDAVLLWIDAHGDFNTPATTESGYLGGMVLAAACGLWDSSHGSGVRPDQVAVVGARDIDAAEQVLLDDAGVTVFPPSASTSAPILDFIDGRRVWVHIDWDVLEPGYVPAAYKVDGGLLPGDIAALLAAIPSEDVLGIEFAEFEAGDPAQPESASLDHILAAFAQVELTP